MIRSETVGAWQYEKTGNAGKVIATAQPHEHRNKDTPFGSA